MKYDIRNYYDKGRVLWMTDGSTEVAVALDLGIRVLHLSHAGMENLLYRQPADLSDNLSTDKGWKIFGGHRLWTAPESDLSYYPDCEGVSYELTQDGVIVRQNKDPWLGVQKRLRLSFSPDGSLLLEHTITNTADAPMTIASWGVTTFDRGEAEVLFGKGTPGSYNPQRTLSLWGDSALSDPRIRFCGEKIYACHKPMENAFKMGVFAMGGTASLVNKQQRFTLTFEADPQGTYPDGGCNFEVYMDKFVLELEALGQSKTIAPGESVSHWERWYVEKI
ncbi:MAG: hypothetical protein J6J43_00610 [Oscillospiraceae bacterium]|nr:hypothetical protein [Oscillospiraceae bacterium]